VGEFAVNCDSGVPLDAGHGVCRPGEFGITCDDAGSDSGLPPTPDLCNAPPDIGEPGILAAFSPASGETVGNNGQIKLWVNDEWPEFIAPGEQLDPNTGAVITPGDRTAKDLFGYLYEPALYIAPETAENGGTPHFPQMIKGDYNNDPTLVNTLNSLLQGGNSLPTLQSAPMDTPPAGTMLMLGFTTEDIWDVKSLGLSPGTYLAEFVIHDGDLERAAGCVTIVITP
jgi:hypothetical protein